MTKNRFGNGGSRGGRSARGKRRNEAQRAASQAGGAASAERATPAERAAGTKRTEPDAGATSHTDSGPAGAGASPVSEPDTVRQAAGSRAAESPAADKPNAATGDAVAAVGSAGEVGSGVEATNQAPDSDTAPAEKLDQLQDRVVTLEGALLRKQADFENFRKRINRDKEEAIKFANTGLLLDLTAVLDDFQRAISAAAQSEDFATLHSGIELIEKQLLNTLQRKWGLTRFDSAGQPFDPERHEALATEPSAEHTEATVIEDYQKGYTLHGRVVRAARVRVATPLERAASDNGPTAEGGPTSEGGSAAGTEASLEEGA